MQIEIFFFEKKKKRSISCISHHFIEMKAKSNKKKINGTERGNIKYK